MSRATALLAGLALALSALVPAATRAQDAQEIDYLRESFLLDQRACKPGTMTRCWYMFFATGEAPTREVFLLDLKTREPADLEGVVELDVIQMFETDDPKVPGANDFVQLTVQYDCRRKKARVSRGYALLFDGTVDRSTEPSPWAGGYENHWYGLAARAACQPDVQLEPQRFHMLWIGSFYRPVDVVDVGRRYLWQQP